MISNYFRNGVILNTISVSNVCLGREFRRRCSESAHQGRPSCVLAKWGRGVEGLCSLPVGDRDPPWALHSVPEQPGFRQQSQAPRGQCSPQAKSLIPAQPASILPPAAPALPLAPPNTRARETDMAES